MVVVVVVVVNLVRGIIGLFLFSFLSPSFLPLLSFLPGGLPQR